MHLASMAPTFAKSSSSCKDGLIQNDTMTQTPCTEVANTLEDMNACWESYLLCPKLGGLLPCFFHVVSLTDIGLQQPKQGTETMLSDVYTVFIWESSSNWSERKEWRVYGSSDDTFMQLNAFDGQWPKCMWTLLRQINVGWRSKYCRPNWPLAACKLPILSRCFQIGFAIGWL